MSTTDATDGPAVMKHRATVIAEVQVTIEWDDDEIITRGLTEGFRRSFYHFDNRDEVLSHLAYNAIANGRRDGQMLDGWADTDRSTLRMDLDARYAFDVDEEVPS